MEQLQNFGPGDVQNGTLAQMFRNAGINDVQSYVADVRHENVDLGGVENNAQPLSDKPSQGKKGLNNVKQIYHMVSLEKKNKSPDYSLCLVQIIG